MLAAVVGLQWGDEGKGRVCDELMSKFDAAVRFNGGPNAGHTVVARGWNCFFRQLPSGMLHPGKANVLGDGVVVDPGGLIDELRELETKSGGSMGRLFISRRAHVITPYNRVLDRLRDSARKADGPTSTWNGVGPTYSDRVLREGIRLVDLLDSATLEESLRIYACRKQRELDLMYGCGDLSSGGLLESYIGYGEKLKGYMADTGKLLRRWLEGGLSVLFEGAQGTMLDVCQGTYPFVTSSHTTVANVFAGAGIPPQKINKVIGVMKPYVTRVGAGPLPTEVKGLNVQLNEKYRAGWLDLVALRHAIEVNGCRSIALTNVDRLVSLESFKVAMEYDIGGNITQDFPDTVTVLHKARPIYLEYQLGRFASRDADLLTLLPEAVAALVDMLERETGIPVEFISSGPERGCTLVNKIYVS